MYSFVKAVETPAKVRASIALQHVFSLSGSAPKPLAASHKSAATTALADDHSQIFVKTSFGQIARHSRIQVRRHPRYINSGSWNIAGAERHYQTRLASPSTAKMSTSPIPRSTRVSPTQSIQHAPTDHPSLYPDQPPRPSHMPTHNQTESQIDDIDDVPIIVRFKDSEYRLPKPIYVYQQVSAPRAWYRAAWYRYVENISWMSNSNSVVAKFLREVDEFRFEPTDSKADLKSRSTSATRSGVLQRPRKHFHAWKRAYWYKLGNFQKDSVIAAIIVIGVCAFGWARMQYFPTTRGSVTSTPRAKDRNLESA